MNKYLFIVFTFLAASPAWAQVDPLYAQYLNNPLLINPAYTGSTNNFNGSLTYRKQWAGFEGSPSTVNASGHMSLFDNKMGVGLIILEDKNGNNRNTEVHGTYAYKLILDDKTLSFGLQAGVINFRSDNSELNPFDPADPAFNANQNTTKPSFGTGIILKSERYFAGLSVPRLLKATNATDNVETSLYSQHFYAAAAYIIFISEDILFKPSLLFKGVKGAPLSVDYNLSFNLWQKYTVGAYTRNLKTYGLLGQIKLGEAFRFGYTFEVPTNKSVGTQFTSHEFCLGVNMDIFNFHDTSMAGF